MALKLIFLIVAVIAIIAYTGIDLSSEYDTVSEIRNQAFENLVDPFAKKVLEYASEFNLDEIIDSTITKYGDDV